MEIRLEIDGMTCGGCVKSLTRVLEAVPGVDNAKVDLETASARVDGDQLDAKALIGAVEDAGFDARVAG
ncbi:MAG: heavy-metal-associated domain-containing protein [Aliihoeflea sp.]